MKTIVHARPVQHTTAVVQANGITTKMEVYGFYEVGDHLHLMATPSVPTTSSGSHPAQSTRQSVCTTRTNTTPLRSRGASMKTPLAGGVFSFPLFEYSDYNKTIRVNSIF